MWVLLAIKYAIGPEDLVRRLPSRSILFVSAGILDVLKESVVCLVTQQMSISFYLLRLRPQLAFATNQYQHRSNSFQPIANMDEPQESIERDASKTVEPEVRLPNMATESGSHNDATSSTDNLTSQQQQQEPHPLPPNPFLQKPSTETEHHAALPTRTMNATPPPTAISAVAVTVRDSHGSEVTFKIKKHTKLNKLMDAFCERQGKTPAQVRFFFDGTRITGDDTPESVCLLPVSVSTANEGIFPNCTKLFLFRDKAWRGLGWSLCSMSTIGSSIQFRVHSLKAR